MDCSTPGFPVLHHLSELAQIHVRWIGDTIQPSRPLSSPLSSKLRKACLSKTQGTMKTQHIKGPFWRALAVGLLTYTHSLCYHKMQTILIYMPASGLPVKLWNWMPNCLHDFSSACAKDLYTESQTQYIKDWIYDLPFLKKFSFAAVQIHLVTLVCF